MIVFATDGIGPVIVSPQNNFLQLGRLPPSAKLVYEVLASGRLLTQKEIINKTYLPPRTVRYALNRLRNEKVITERFCFKDARQSLYGLRGGGAVCSPPAT